MIPRAHITAWRSVAPWQNDAQVEQDLVISRCLVEIFSDEMLREHLAFRGGTAIHKLHLAPAVRYSEDIDMIQIKAGPIGPVFDRIREKLYFLDKPQRRQRNRNSALIFRFESEVPPVVNMKLKLEINCREHLAIFDIVQKPLKLNSAWFSGETRITTFTLEELLGSKLRALYQRKKGRDLFDLWYALVSKHVNQSNIIVAFLKFMDAENAKVSHAQFDQNLKAKIEDREFIRDIQLLTRPGLEYDTRAAYELVMRDLVSKLE